MKNFTYHNCRVLSLRLSLQLKFPFNYRWRRSTADLASNRKLFIICHMCNYLACPITRISFREILACDTALQLSLLCVMTFLCTVTFSKEGVSNHCSSVSCISGFELEILAVCVCVCARARVYFCDFSRGHQSPLTVSLFNWI